MELPIEKNPLVRTFNCNAYALGVYLASLRGTPAFLHNFFIQLTAPPQRSYEDPLILFHPHVGPVTFERCRLGTQVSSRASTGAEFQNKVWDYLCDNRHVRLLVDEFYIPNRRYYNKAHYLHDILVYGMTPDRTAANVIGYCEDRRYKPSCCPMESLTQGYLEGEGLRGAQQSIIAFRSEGGGGHAVSPDMIAYQMANFLNGRFAAAQTAGLPGQLYGINALTRVTEHLEKVLQSNAKLDLRCFSVVAEHARCLLMKARYFQGSNRGPKPTTLLQASIERYGNAADRAAFLSLAYRTSKDVHLLKALLVQWQEVLILCRRAGEALLEMLLKPQPDGPTHEAVP